MSLSKSDSGKLGYIKSKETIDNLRILKKKLSVENYVLENKKCKNCECLIPYEIKDNIFCNSSCSAIYNNKNKAKKQSNCKNCNSPISKKNQYCNNECQNSYKRSELINACLASAKVLKTHLIKIHGEKCMNCGWGELNKHSNTIPIELDHIDGNSENNTLKNVRLLCPNCHSLTPTYKSLNIGNGRHYRLTRRKDGKSF